MSRVVASFVLSLLMCTSSLAQEMIFTTPIKKTSVLDVVRVIGTDDVGFWVMTTNVKEKKVELFKFGNADMKELMRKSVSYADIAQDIRFEDILFTGERIFLFTSTFSADSEQIRIYCTQLDKEANVIGEPVLVHFILSEGREHASGFGVATSPDKGKILVYFDPPFERKTTEALSFRCYEQDLDMIWEKELLLPYGPQTIQVHQFIPDNDGNVYMLSGRKRNNGFEKPAKPESGRHILYYYQVKENKLKEYDITLADKQIASVKLCFDQEGKLIIAGYYSVDYKMNVSGSFFYVVEKSGKGMNVASFMPFRSNTSGRYHLDDSAEFLPDFYLKSVLPVEGGHTLLIGEQQYLTEHVIQDHPMNSPGVETRYHFDHILITELDSGGRHIHNNIIPKEQYSLSDFSNYSFVVASKGNSVEIIFNDNKDSGVQFPEEKVARKSPWTGGTNSITNRVIQDENGTLSASPLFVNKEIGGVLNCEISYDDADSAYLIIAISEGNTVRLSAMKK